MAEKLLEDYLTFRKNESNYTDEEQQVIIKNFKKELGFISE